MPVSFTLGDDGHLEWRSQETLTPDLTEQQAGIIAAAEAAAALRYIGEALHSVAEAIAESGSKG